MANTPDTAALAARCMQLARDRLLMPARFLNVALLALQLEGTQADGTDFATDGTTYRYPMKAVLEEMKVSPALLSHRYLHSVLHCLLRHMVPPAGVAYHHWNAACDLVVEHLIDTLDLPQIRTSEDALRHRDLEQLRQQVPSMQLKRLLSFLQGPGGKALFQSQLQRRFRLDDHTLWFQADELAVVDPMGRQKQAQVWLSRCQQAVVHLETLAADRSDEGAKAFVQYIRRENLPAVSYPQFLRKFVGLCEERRLSQTGFDPILYTYGMEVYGNLPLIEPLESRLSRRLRHFLIALDTSGSCDGPLLRQFLRKTQEILQTAGLFTQDVVLHVVECDDRIQAVQVVEGLSNLRHFQLAEELHGFGNTDFRPVFAYARQICQERRPFQWDGILYFTDGMGTFPQQMPPWKTAFVLVRTDLQTPPDVPPWAYRIVLEPEDLTDTA